jgi:tRNA(adenine34) deaminase
MHEFALRTLADPAVCSKDGKLMSLAEHSGKADVETHPVDEAMMARCIELSKIGAAAGELPIGSLVAHRGKIITEATNEIEHFTDESRHAEIVAIARARKLLGDHELSKCTLYSTVEPCPMCAFCIRTAGIGRVVFALGSPLLGGSSRWNILGDDRYPLLFGQAPEMVAGVLADEAHKAWIDLRPIMARAIWWFGFLNKPEKPGATARPRSRHRYSIRIFISLFLRRRTKQDSADAAVISLQDPLRE